MFSVEETVYFNTPGEVNTQKTVEVAIDAAVRHDVQAVVVATETGRTAFALADEAKKRSYTGKLIAVRYHIGFSGVNEDLMPKENLEKLIGMGISVHAGTHAFSSIARSFRMKWQGLEVTEIVAETLRLFGKGVKTACEITVMAADAGLVPDVTRNVIGIAGTSTGADTAILLRTASQNTFLQQLRIRRVLAKPEDF